MPRTDRSVGDSPSPRFQAGEIYIIVKAMPLFRAEIAALGQAIEDQFKLWKLTSAEIDIAGLMLKGAALKEIALARDTSEATIRQQAQSIYRKSGLSGRAELSAYFLDSLFAEADDLRGAKLRVVPTEPRL